MSSVDNKSVKVFHEMKIIYIKFTKPRKLDVFLNIILRLNWVSWWFKQYKPALKKDNIILSDLNLQK